MKILIGSSALKHHFPDFPRKPKDTDYAVSSRMKSDRETEFLYNPVFCEWIGKYFEADVKMTDPVIPSPNDLYTLKISHLFWDINWNKHLYDVLWLQERGCKLVQPLFDQLYSHWNEYHGKNKRSKLDMRADNFFDNAVKCPYNHDWLHTLIKDPPTYTKVLKDGAEVDVSEEKFNTLSVEDKINLVKEEVMIMSYERKFHKDYRHSYGRMLKKFIMNHAPMWEALWIIQNFKLVYRPDFNYFKFITDKIQEHDTDQFIKFNSEAGRSLT